MYVQTQFDYMKHNIIKQKYNVCFGSNKDYSKIDHVINERNTVVNGLSMSEISRESVII